MPDTAANPHHLVVTYQIYEGPQVMTASVVTLGRQHTRQSFIDRTAQVSAGRPMTESEMLTSGSKLYTPGIFDWAEVDPRRQITTQNREDLIVKVPCGTLVWTLLKDQVAEGENAALKSGSASMLRVSSAQRPLLRASAGGRAAGRG